MHRRLVEVGGGGIRVRRLGGDRAGEVRLTRFLRNTAVRPEEMADTAARALAPRCAGRHVLAIQDTTVVSSQGGGGLYLHVMLAVDAEDDAVLGLVGGEFLHRTQGRKAVRHATPIEHKESHRWLRGAEQAARICAAAQRVTVVADREADIFEAFAQCPATVDLLVRATHDRALAGGARLFAQADALPVASRTTLELPARPGRAARTVALAIRHMAAPLRAPRRIKRPAGLDPVTVHLVDVREEGGREEGGREEGGTHEEGGRATTPIHWRLLTTHPVRNGEDAQAVIAVYRRRWAIEQLFRTMKTQGFDIEGVRIEDDVPRRNLVMAALVAAVTVQQLVHARDGRAGPDGMLRPLADAFAPADKPLLEAWCATLEGKTARQKNPHPPGSLAYAAWVCARLGGWTGYYGKPGPLVMLKGWQQFQAGKTAVAAWLNAHV